MRFKNWRKPEVFQRDYLFLPKEFHNRHDVCMDLLSQMEEVMISDDYLPLRIRAINLEKEGELDQHHILDYLLSKDRKEEHDEIIRNHVIIALFTDVCYFTQEAMTCAIKSRLTVCFAMLRKPFVYTMIVMLRLLFEEGFIDKFNNDESFDPSSIAPNDRKELIGLAIQVIPLKIFSADDIENWVFDKESPDSIINLADGALHLKTNRNKKGNAKITEKQNFNFIFSNHEAIQSQWDLLYRVMPALLLFLVSVSDVVLATVPGLPDDIMEKRMIKRAVILKQFNKIK
jgi:hypothetical protein